MPEEALLKAIEEDARAQSKRVVEEAEAEARNLVRRAGEEVERARVERLHALTETMGKRRASMVGSARVRARALAVEAEIQLVDEVIRDAEQKIKGLPEEEYRGLINNFYEGLKREWQREREDEPVVHINPEERRFIKGPAEINPDPEVSLGVAFTSKDGRVRFENTFASRVKKLKERIVAEAHKILFPEMHAHGPQLL